MFTESSTVEQMVLDALSSRSGGSGGPSVLFEEPTGWRGSLGGKLGKSCQQTQGDTA